MTHSSIVAYGSLVKVLLLKRCKRSYFFYSLGEKDTLRFEILVFLFTTWLTGEHDAFVVCRSHHHLFVYDPHPCFLLDDVNNLVTPFLVKRRERDQ